MRRHKELQQDWDKRWKHWREDPWHLMLWKRKCVFFTWGWWDDRTGPHDVVLRTL